MNTSTSTSSAIPNLRQRRWAERIFFGVCLLATLLGVILLGMLLYNILRDGWSSLSLRFLQNFPSRFPDQAGVRSALYGTLWVIGLTAFLSIPVGVAAAIYLEELAPKNRLTAFIQINISNLAGVPSIVYGLLGLAIFVRSFALGRSVLAGALTMSLLILPTIIIATQEALRAVPNSLREASLGLGATRWQTVRHQVLPVAFAGIMTGVILAISRAIGETAPLITIGAFTFVAFVPSGIYDSFTVLPIQIFHWASRPQEAFQKLAAAAIIVLLGVLLLMNSIAIYIRYRQRRIPL
jgi:phosphate transport system permease protein